MILPPFTRECDEMSMPYIQTTSILITSHHIKLKEKAVYIYYNIYVISNIYINYLYYI